MGTETATVHAPSDAQPAAPELVSDLEGMPWNELRGYAKSLGVSLTENHRIRSRASLTPAVRARQAERWPGFAARPDGNRAGMSAIAATEIPMAPAEGGPAPTLSTPTAEVFGDTSAVEREALGEPAPDSAESLPEQPEMAEMVEPPEPEPPVVIRCIGCGKPVEGLPADSDPTAQVLCLDCDAARAAVLAGAAKRNVEVEDEEPAISDEELNKLLLSEPSLAADQAPHAKEAVVDEEPPGNGPWQLWSPFGSLNPIVRQGRPGRLLPEGGEIARVPGLSVQFENHEATVKDKGLMRFLMRMDAWKRGEMRFKTDILSEGLVAREVSLIIDKARARGLAIPDRESLTAKISAETSGSAPLPDRASGGVTPGKGHNTPGLNSGVISTRPTNAQAPARTPGVTRGPLGSGADIELVE